MNEIEFIRAQLLAERTHAAQIADACVTAIGAGKPAEAGQIRAFCDSCVSYLVWVLTRFEQRDQLLAEHLQGGLGASESPPAGLREAAARAGTSREALSKLEAALAATESQTARATWQEFAHFFHCAWSARRAAIEQQLRQLPGMASWRAVCAVDADSILEERTRYGRVIGQIPAGVTLREPPA